MGTAKDFWDWFEAHEAGLRIVDGSTMEKTEALDTIIEVLQDYCPVLDVIMQFSLTADGTFGLRFTAHGNKDGLLPMRRLLDEAPRLERWEFKGFVRNNLYIEDYEAGEDPVYEFAHFPLQVSNMLFVPTNADYERQLLEITVYCEGYRKALDHLTYETIQHCVYSVVEDMLGEVIYRDHINDIAVEDVRALEEYANELYLLESFIDMEFEIEDRPEYWEREEKDDE